MYKPLLTEPSGQVEIRRLEINRELKLKEFEAIERELEVQQQKEELEAQQRKEELEAQKYEKKLKHE